MVTDSLMIGLLWYAMMRMFRFLEITNPSGGQLVSWLNQPQRFYCFLNNNYNNTGEVKHVAGGSEVTDAQSTANQLRQNEFVQADLNFNRPDTANQGTELKGRAGTGGLLQQNQVEVSHMSTTSSNGEESLTINDGSDYQWFPDYVYGDTGNNTSMPQHRPSIFSVHNYSSNLHELNYEAISRNIDANLAEIDMEDFRSEDINSILAIPAMYCGDRGMQAMGDYHSSGSHGEQTASLSASIMAHFDDDYYVASTESERHHDQQLSISINSDSTDMSVCKSEQLFSPIKEAESPSADKDRRYGNNRHRNDEQGAVAAVPHLTTFSVDSLDCDSYDEQELILTCQTNVDNYTIAFEGSMSRESEDSDYHDEAVVCETSDTESWSNLNLHNPKLRNFKLRNFESVNGSLVQSDFVYTTWTKLKRSINATSGSSHQHQHERKERNGTNGAACNKSQSLPNLCRSKINPSTSFKISQLNISNTDSAILDQSQRCIPLYDVTTSSPSSSSIQSLSLMRLFMQNRTNSSSSSCSSTGNFGSITHSLSSGTLYHQLANSQQSDALNERLQTFINTKLTNNNSEVGSENSQDSNQHVYKRRAVSPLGSPIEEVDESDNTTTTTSNKITQNTLKNNKISDDSIDENSANELELELDATKPNTLTVNELTQGTQTSCSNLSGNNNSTPMIYNVNNNNNNIHRGDSGVSLSSSKDSKVSPMSAKCRGPDSKVNSVTITMFTTRGTQLPVHVCDEAIQTSFKGEWLERILAKCTPKCSLEERELEENKEDSKTTEKPSSTIYVCYPNYSLPDLGFLKNLSKEELPAKVQLSPKKTTPRPKSCPGLTTLQPCANDLARIKDWDSLNVLLPQKVKELIKGWRTTDVIEPKNSPSNSQMRVYHFDNVNEDKSDKNSQEKLNGTPRSILRRSKTDPTSDIVKLVVPSTLNLRNSDVKTAQCKCPVSGELTEMLGISLEQCDCDNLSGSTIGNICGLDNDSNSQEDAKNKKVSFSSRPSSLLPDKVVIKSSEVNVKEWTPIMEMAEDKDIPPQEFFVSPVRDNTPTSGGAAALFPRVNSPHSLSWDRKQDLVNALNESVKTLNQHFDQAKDPHTKFLLGNGHHTPATGFKIINQLCPALFDILNDGLQPSVYNIFGHMENSVWMVVESLAQSGSCTKQIVDLVVHVNNEQNILDKKLKFNAFILGLLNIRSLATWFSLLGSNEQLLHKHYSPSALLATATTSLKFLFDELLTTLQTLSLLPFDLDLNLEFQLLEKPTSSSTTYQSQPHRICLSLSPSHVKTSRKTEEKSKSKHSRASKLVHRHSYGLLLDELVKQQNEIDCNNEEEKVECKSQRLRRGLSQDSAIELAKNSTECLQKKTTNIPTRSNEEHREGWALKDFPKRPWSYAQDLDFEFDESSQNSSKELCSSCSAGNNSESSTKEVKDIHEMVSANGETVKEEEQKSVDTEKGSLDAKITERKQSANDDEHKNQSNENSSEDGEDSVQFKQLQMRWEILSGASAANNDKKRATNSNSRSKIPRLVMQLPTSPSPKLKQRFAKQSSDEAVPHTNLTALNSVQPSINRSSVPNRAAPTSTQEIQVKISSPEKSPVKKKLMPGQQMSRVALSSNVAAKTQKKCNGTAARGAVGGEDTPI